MGKLYELLAAEATVSGQFKVLFTETMDKFKKSNSYFSGHVKTLTMLEDSPSNRALEASSREEKVLATNVPDTLSYLMDYWVKKEDVLFQKNRTNQAAVADIVFRGRVLATNVPVDELMGLEARLKELRELLAAMPTLDASKNWVPDTQRGRGYWVAESDVVSVKTEKVFVPLVLTAATDKHPAQVKESFVDKPVGSYTQRNFSGAAKSEHKADALGTVDDLIVAVRQARNKANTVEAVTDRIGSVIMAEIMGSFS